MENNLILEGLLSMVTELKEKQEAAGNASQSGGNSRTAGTQSNRRCRNCTVTRLFPKKELRAIRSQLDEIRSRMQGQQKNISRTPRK